MLQVAITCEVFDCAKTTKDVLSFVLSEVESASSWSLSIRGSWKASKIGMTTRVNCLRSVSPLRVPDKRKLLKSMQPLQQSHSRNSQRSRSPLPETNRRFIFVTARIDQCISTFRDDANRSLCKPNGLRFASNSGGFFSFRNFDRVGSKNCSERFGRQHTRST